MPESDEKRELGELAQSIDALFSQRPPPPEVAAPEEDPPIVEDPAGPVPEVDDALADELLEVPVSGEAADELDSAGFEPDPFDALDAVEAVTPEGSEPPELPSLETEPPVAELEVSGSEIMEPAGAEPDMAEPDMAEPDSWSEPASTAVPDVTDVEAPPAVDVEASAEPSESAEAEPVDPEPADPVEAAPAEGPPEPPGAALAEAVDAFLAGHPGAGKEVERIAAKLRERLALDPLADAAERLVTAAEDDFDDPALLVAGKIVNPAVASRIVQRMALEENEPHRKRYLALTSRLGTVMANAFKGVLTDATDERTRRACYDGLIALGDEGRPVIEAMVEDDNRFLVRNGITILGETGGDGAVELVTSALANTDFRVRRDAVTALGKLGGDESGQLIMASLEDPDPTVRAAAAEAAGQLGLERALRPILALLEDDTLPDDDKVPIQIQALRALGDLGDPGAVQAIEKRATGSLFSKPPTELRVAAYRALHDIGTPHAREVIEKAKSDKDPVVRTTVRGFDAA